MTFSRKFVSSTQPIMKNAYGKTVFIEIRTSENPYQMSTIYIPIHKNQKKN